MRKNYVCHAPYLKKHILFLFMVHMCKMIISTGIFFIFSNKMILIFRIVRGVTFSGDNIFRCFFHFFKILIFQVVRNIKRQKITQNDKKLCLSCLICQKPYIILSSFMVHMCNSIISPGFFKIYSKFLFLGSTVR